jgi:hypothetical protein
VTPETADGAAGGIRRSRLHQRSSLCGFAIIARYKFLATQAADTCEKRGMH